MCCVSSWFAHIKGTVQIRVLLSGETARSSQRKSHVSCLWPSFTNVYGWYSITCNKAWYKWVRHGCLFEFDKSCRPMLLFCVVFLVKGGGTESTLRFVNTSWKMCQRRTTKIQCKTREKRSNFPFLNCFLRCMLPTKSGEPKLKKYQLQRRESKQCMRSRGNKRTLHMKRWLQAC